MTSENSSTEQDGDDTGRIEGNLSLAPADHDHTVDIVIILECGHEFRYTKSVEYLSMFPGRVETGTSWVCLTCPNRGTRLGPRRAVSGCRYDYRCRACLPRLTGETPPRHAQLPSFQPFNWTHDHDRHDIAGYVVVRIERQESGPPHKSTDVARVPGAQHYIHAAGVVEEFDRTTREPTTAHAIVYIYSDGCRRDLV